MRQQNASMCSAGSQAGFTLLEMLVVLGLLGLLAAVSMPLVRSGGETALIERISSRLAADLSATRQAAIKTNIAAHLDIDLITNSYTATPHMATRQLPPQVPIRIKTDSATLGQMGSASIQFFPDGSSDGAKIVVGAGGQGRIISVDRLTGRIRIARGPG